MTECVWSNSFALQARTECGGSGAMDAKARCDCVSTDADAALRCEYGILRLTVGSSLDPFAQSERGQLVEWCDAVFAAFAMAEEVWLS